jgi:hypothetical protein
MLKVLAVNVILHFHFIFLAVLQFSLWYRLVIAAQASNNGRLNGCLVIISLLGEQLLPLLESKFPDKTHLPS